MLHELLFKGQWRQYQKRILDKSDTYMSDGKIHLVAAPGSVKTRSIPKGQCFWFSP